MDSSQSIDLKLFGKPSWSTNGETRKYMFLPLEVVMARGYKLHY